MPTPTGKPAWLRTNDHTHYGGHVNKTNYESVGTVNPRTDLSAENLCRIAADLAAIQRTAPFAIMVYTSNDTATTDPTIDYYSAMAGAAPVGVRAGDGVSFFTWDAFYNDPYGESADIHIIGAKATVLGSGSAFCVINIDDPDTNGKNERINVNVFDDTGTLLADQKVAITIYTGTL